MELTLDEAATKLGKTVRQVRYLIQKGELPARKAGGRWLIDNDDLPRSEAKKGVDERKERGLRRAVEDALELPEKARRYSVTDLTAFQVALPTSEPTIFLGYRISRSGINPGRKLKKRMKKRLRQLRHASPDAVARSLRSYRGLMTFG